MTQPAALYRRLRAEQVSTSLRVRRALAVRLGRHGRWTEAERALVHDTVAVAVASAADRSPGPSAGLVQACREIASVAARHGRPPGDVDLYVETVTCTVQAAFWRLADPGDHQELAACSAHLDDLAGRLRVHMGQAYVEALHRADPTPGTLQYVATAIVAGRATEDMLRAAGSVPAGRYRVIALRAGAGTDAAVAVSDVLLRVPGVLSCSVQGDTVVIEPYDAHPPDDRMPGGLAAVLRDEPRLVRVAMAVEPASGLPAVAAAVTAARELLDQVVRLGRSGRPCTRQELLLESRLLGDPVAARTLRGLVRGLDGEPDLIRTLQVLYLNDLDRTRTAHELGIARRTLAYRTERIRDLTGLNPTGARAVRVLGLGLAALRAHRP